MLFGMDWMVVVIFLLCVLFLWYVIQVKFTTHRNKARIISALSKEPYFHGLLVGLPFKADPWQVGEHKLYADARYIVIIKRDDVLIGALGFDVSRRALLVRQMQGFRGVNMRGVELAPTLILIAEKIARVLKKKEVWIQAAQRNFYFVRTQLETREGAEEQRKHQARMVETYNATPLRLGYTEHASSGTYVHGYFKVLRKCITLQRIARLYVLILNRALQKESVSVQELVNND